MQRKGQNKRSITRCFLCMNLYAQQIKVRPSLSTDSCTMLAGKSTVFSTSPITIATVHEIHLQLVFSVVIVTLCLLFCKLFFLFYYQYIFTIKTNVTAHRSKIPVPIPGSDPLGGRCRSGTGMWDHGGGNSVARSVCHSWHSSRGSRGGRYCMRRCQLQGGSCILLSMLFS